MTRRQRSSAPWLALVFVVLVVYASLYPFEGWRWPPGQALATLALLPRAVHQSDFDIWSNVLGYMPLGALLAVSALRRGWRAGPAVALALGAPALLSYGCEVLQHFVPARVPTREDFVMNAAGALAGGLLAVAGHALGLVDRWSRVRARWFAGDAAFAIVLLVLWPVALLFPAPVPLGLGEIGPRLREWAAVALEGTPWSDPAWPQALASAAPAQAMHPLVVTMLVALGLMAPGLVAFSVIAPGWRRLATVLGVLALALASMTISTLLNFGPEHALSWLGPRTWPGLMLGAALTAACAPLPRRLVAGVGLIVLTALVAGVARAPDNPYFALSLQAWEQGRFVRFHGLAQWLGWLWPFAAMGWLLSRLATRP